MTALISGETGWGQEPCWLGNRVGYTLNFVFRKDHGVTLS